MQNTHALIIKQRVSETRKPCIVIRQHLQVLQSDCVSKYLTISMLHRVLLLLFVYTVELLVTADSMTNEEM